MNFVLALAMSFSKFGMTIFSERPFCQTTIANFVTNVEKMKRIELKIIILSWLLPIQKFFSLLNS
jgi:hypothetical protein